MKKTVLLVSVIGVLLLGVSAVDAQTADEQLVCTCTCTKKANDQLPIPASAGTNDQLMTNVSIINDPIQAIAQTPELRVPSLPTEASAKVGTESQAASPSDVLINEVVSSPSDGQLEWVELYNRSSKTFDLTGWQLIDGAGSKTNLTGTLLPQSYVVFNKTGLNNAGDKLEIRDTNAIQIDAVTYGDWQDGFMADNAPVAGEPNSLIRTSLESDDNIDFQDFAVTTTVTKGSLNIFTPIIATGPTPEPVTPTPTVEPAVVDALPVVAVIPDSVVIEPPVLAPVTTIPPVDYSSLVITELLPNPVGTDTGFEWIELFNSGSVDLNLKGLSLDDEDGGSPPFTFQTDLIIPAKQYVVVDNAITKIALNNTTDYARVLDKNKAPILEVRYASAVEGESYAFISGKWQWTPNTTPGAVNGGVVATAVESGPVKTSSWFSIPTALAAEDTGVSVPVVTLDQIATLPLGSAVSVEGALVVEPNIFGPRIAYLNGMQLYASNGDWPTMERDDPMVVVGKISEVAGERRIVIKDMDLSDRADLNAESVTITAESLTDEVVGQLVTIHGEVLEKSGTAITMADDTGEFTILLKPTTGLTAKQFTVGEAYTVTGIVGKRYKELRIMPRDAADIELVPTITAPSTVSSTLPFADTPKRSSQTRVILVVLGCLAAGLYGCVKAWPHKDRILAWVQQRLLKIPKQA